jgi:cbb3-type cytochrome oxidase subunit 3
MSSSLQTYILLSLILVAVCVYALWKGGPAERAGAMVIIVLSVVERLAHGFPQGWWPIISLCGDALTALGLLFVALRYASFWLGGVMLLYAAQFTLHSFYLVTGRSSDTPLHIVISDVNFAAILVCLTAGTTMAWRARRKAAAAEAQAPAAS